jgi:hypothetical protein
MIIKNIACVILAAPMYTKGSTSLGKVVFLIRTRFPLAPLVLITRTSLNINHGAKAVIKYKRKGRSLGPVTLNPTEKINQNIITVMSG